MMCNLCAAIGKAQTVKSDEPHSNDQGQNNGEGIQLTQHNNGKSGMVLPFEQHSITFDGIIYSVDMPLVTYIINICN